MYKLNILKISKFNLLDYYIMRVKQAFTLIFYTLYTSSPSLHLYLSTIDYKILLKQKN